MELVVSILMVEVQIQGDDMVEKNERWQRDVVSPR